jgi:hypothetical protein
MCVIMPVTYGPSTPTAKLTSLDGLQALNSHGYSWHSDECSGIRKLYSITGLLKYDDTSATTRCLLSPIGTCMSRDSSVSIVTILPSGQ